MMALLAGLVVIVIASSSGSASAVSSKVVTFAYPSTYVLDTPQLATRWVNEVVQQFQQANPGVRVNLVPIPGSYNDIVTKMSLLYRSPSTAPDVSLVPTGQVGLWASSGYLSPMNSYLPSTSWWQHFPAVVQREGNIKGHIYAVNQSEVVIALMYDKTLFARAGLPVPWKPTSWNDILTAARKIKKALPGVTPFWMNAGSGSGSAGLEQGINNFIYGTSTPQIVIGSKVVIDSPGIRAALAFLKTVISEGLDASESQLFNPSAVATPLTLFPKGKLAIAVGATYFPGAWTKFVSAPYWPQAPTVMASTPVPHQTGGGIASTLGAWDYVLSARSKNPSAAFKLISVLEDKRNSLDVANWAGGVPPDSQYWSDPTYTAFAKGQAYFAQLLPHATLTPSGSSYPVWAQGMENATAAIVQNPATSIDDAISILGTFVKNQLGSSETIVLH